VAHHLLLGVAQDPQLLGVDPADAMLEVDLVHPDSGRRIVEGGEEARLALPGGGFERVLEGLETLFQFRLGGKWRGPSVIYADHISDIFR
jgi:hypothetical protein